MDDTVTIRDRDSLAQERISIARAREHLLDRLAAPWSPPRARRSLCPDVANPTRRGGRKNLSARYTQVSDMTTSPLFTSCGRVARGHRPARWAPLPGRARERRDRHRRAPGDLGAPRPCGPGLADATSSSTRTTAWTPGCSPGCPARERGSTTTTSRASGSLSRRAASGRTSWSTGASDIALHLRPGDTRQGGPGYIHRVRHETGEPAVTIHVYSPRLDWVGQYRLGDDGHRPPRGASGPERAHRAAHRTGRARAAFSSGSDFVREAGFRRSGILPLIPACGGAHP